MSGPALVVPLVLLLVALAGYPAGRRRKDKAERDLAGWSWHHSDRAARLDGTKKVLADLLQAMDSMSKELASTNLRLCYIAQGQKRDQS